MKRELSRAYHLIQKHGIREFFHSIDKIIAIAVRYEAHRAANFLRYGSSAPGYYDMIKIDPTEIDKMVVPQFYLSEPRVGGHVKGGDWDVRKASSNIMYSNRYENAIDNRCLLPIIEFGLYKSMKKHFEDGLPWSETEFYDWITDTPYGKYDSQTAIENRLSDLDYLYKEIKTNGYNSQRELRNDTNVILDLDQMTPPEHNEVWIDITRDGEIVFEEGRHRFIIAKLAEVDEIPARVFVRHKKWQEKRKMVSKGQVPKNVDPRHPDLQTLSIKQARSSVGDC